MIHLLLDTGPLVALLAKDEAAHPACVNFLKDFKGKLMTSEAVLVEALYLLNDSFLHQKKCVEFVLAGTEVIPSSSSSLDRCLNLMEKYQDVPMDFADATLVTLAEELKTGEIFTLDHRGFETYRWNRNQPFKIYP